MSIYHTLTADSVMIEFHLNRVLQNVYLKCETGKIIGLLGRNGSGKSCLMRTIIGELRPKNSTIQLDGVSYLDGKRKPEDILYLPQFNFIPGAFRLKRVFRDFNLDLSSFIQAFPDFEKYASSKIKSLSSGERRIVEIYTMLKAETKFCMLDEPFSMAMPLHIDTIKKLIVQEKKKKGILLTDHMYKHIIEICDEIYVIKDGTIYLTTSVDDIEKLGYIRSRPGIVSPEGTRSHV